MQAFHIYYYNTQGTLMRILTAVSRRALELTYVQAQCEPNDQTYRVTLLLDVNAKQIGQLSRDWFAIMDVTDVRAVAPESIGDRANSWPVTGRPPSSTTRTADDISRAARA
jgi:acetolactate synthase small subunit